jgi:large subunit ribosomal protein L25
MTVKAALAAEKRDGTGKSVTRKMRAAGKIPAVVYGADQESMPITLDSHDTLQLFQSISVDNTIISVAVEGVDEPLETLVREIQVHPLRQQILHVDFLAIQSGVAIELEIPVNFQGTPTGVRDGGGILDVILHDLRVRCIPSMIPEEIIVDITSIEVGQSLHAEEISMPEGVEIVTEGIRTVCSVALPKVVVADEEEEDLEGLEGEGAEGALETDEDSDAGGDE